MTVTGVIQAGGKSTRMGGRPKALLDLGGRPIIERVIDAMAASVSDLLLVTNTPDLYAYLGLPMVADAYPDHGSLGGIFSGLRAAPGAVAFTVACGLVRALAEPVTAPSANLSGLVPPTSAMAVLRDFGGTIEMILDVGETVGGLPSTVLDVTVDPPRVIRQGAVTV